jgi:hypothetical protein
MKIILLWLCLLFGVWTCDPPSDTKLKLINASNKPVLIAYNTEGTNHTINGLSGDYNPFHEIQQADTTRGYQIGLMKDNPDYILPGDTISAQLGTGKWENHIGNGKLWVYVFKPETVLSNDWDEIRMGQKWDKVYSLTLDQVRAKNWIINL